MNKTTVAIGSRRLMVAGSACAAGLLALGSLAAACTGIGMDGKGHYLEVTPDAGAHGTPVVVAGYKVAATGSCPGSPCPGTSGTGVLYQSSPLPSTAVTAFVTEPVFGVHQTVGCTTPIGTVTWASPNSQLLSVAGTGSVVRPTGVTGPQLFQICADPDPAYLWGYFAMI